jgi:hypothetical protein
MLELTKENFLADFLTPEQTGAQSDSEDKLTN